jgi:hypothetical protein
MRTTVDIPDTLFRETKRLAATRSITIRQFIIEAIEQAKNPQAVKESPGKVRKFPSFHLRSRRQLDPGGFDFDDLLG